MSNGFPLCPIYLFTPSPPSLSIYSFLISFCCFYGSVLLATLCLINAFPPRTNRLSDATSTVKLYLSHAGVHFDEIWSHKFKRTHISPTQAWAIKWMNTPPLSPCFPLFNSSLHSVQQIAGELSLRHYLKSIFRHWKVFYFLITRHFSKDF